jgi:hypothetical protein
MVVLILTDVSLDSMAGGDILDPAGSDDDSDSEQDKEELSAVKESPIMRQRDRETKDMEHGAASPRQPADPT